MERRNIMFEANIQGEKKDLIVNVPVGNGSVMTNEFCPQVLLTGGMQYIEAVNGESLDDFLSDCNSQIIAMKQLNSDESRLNIHIGGLMMVINSHLQRCGRLIFGDLLIYVDCFSHLLKADGFSEKKIREIYPKITKAIVDLYPNYMKDSINLAPLHKTRIYSTLSNL